MLETYTPGAQRALDRASARAARRGAPLTQPADLLAALLDEPESRAAVLLAEFGLDTGRLWALLGMSPGPEEQLASPGAPGSPFSADLRALLGEAALAARAVDRNRAVATEHLLAPFVSAPGPLSEILAQAGLDVAALHGQLTHREKSETSAIPLDPEIAPLELAGPAQAVDLGRILDASSNRAREGLRVVEDYVRFVWNDPMLSRRLKDVRHRLDQAVRGLDLDLLLASRDTPGDVGAHIALPTEQVRENPRSVLAANFKRTGEALRSLEEYAKLLDVWLAGRFEVLRYDLYTLEKLVLTAVASHQSLGEACLYVLVGGQATLGELTWLVGEALAGGAQVIQLREKGRSDRDVLERARAVRKLTNAARARFILNDRPDLARLAGADGVHLGQEDLPIVEARRAAGPGMVLGLSTHDLEQIEQGIVAGAGYLGVGPVFPSGTKDFAPEDLAGLELVRNAAAQTTLPWFAIGGISEANLDEVLAAGATRIAVSSAVVRAERPREAARRLRDRLEA